MAARAGSSKGSAGRREAPQHVRTRQLPLAARQEKWFEKAAGLISEERLQQLDLALTDIHSPTGEEREISEFIARYLDEAGFEAEYQPMTEDSGNAVAYLRGSGDGPSVMLYAPVDTHIEADPAFDVPWCGPELRADMVPEGQLRDGLVVGLGAANPKAMVTTLIEAARCVKESGAQLKGDIVLAFAGGGMPVSSALRDKRGLSDGVMHMLNRGVTADFGLIMKPWNFVYYEEAGLCWFRVNVRGSMGYSGVPRGIPTFRSSIVPAATVIQEIEAWLPEYTKKNASGQISPEGWIAAVHSGWPDRPAFPSATTEILVDIRITPRTPPSDVKAQFGDQMNRICRKHPEIDLDWEMIASCPTGSTDPDNWIIHSAQRGWERVEGKKHPKSPRHGGQTDGAAIRNYGIPMARLGWPWPYDGMPEELADGLGGMGVTHIPDLVPCCKKLIYAIIDTCSRSRKEVGL
ncbi:MAG: acetylornithine deacetylase [Alphaproteobacteria bacterium]